MNKERLEKLQAQLKNAILIKKKENLFYLTGHNFDHRAEEYLLVNPKRINKEKGKLMHTDFVGFGSGLEHINWIQKSDRLKNIGQYIQGKKLGLEWGFTYGEGEYLKYKIKDLGLKVKVEPERSLVDEMRQVKEAGEIAKIKQSMQIVAQVFELLKKELKNGRLKAAPTEKAVANYITKTGYKMGGEDISFPAIVASGANAAIPHHVPGNKKLKAGESVIIDFGFKFKNYCSDFTRTVFLKRVPIKLEKAYNQVEKAYWESMNYIDERLAADGGAAGIVSRQGGAFRPRDARRLPISAALPINDYGVLAGDVYQKAVDVLAEAKLDKYFIHSLGHGTGLEIHELPNLSPKSKDMLVNGMVFSIEPGVYFPKEGGIRIEDLVYLKNGRVSKFIEVSTRLKDNII